MLPKDPFESLGPSCAACGMPRSLHAPAQPVGDACCLLFTHTRTRRPAPPPIAPPPVATQSFSEVWKEMQPLFTAGLQTFLNHKVDRQRRTRNENKRSARFEIAAERLAEAATWAIIMAEKPGNEWKDLLSGAILDLKAAQEAILAPEPDPDPDDAYEVDKEQLCTCGAARDATSASHRTDCPLFAPNCSCDAGPYLAPEMHINCALGDYVRDLTKKRERIS